MTLEEAKLDAKIRLESLISECYDEIRNIERFTDDRMLIATANLATSYRSVEESAATLEEVFEADRKQQEAAEEEGCNA
jgi:hypothetical protein